MAKDKAQKKKDREKRVAKKKLQETARRRELAKATDEQQQQVGGRTKQVMTKGVKQQVQSQNQAQSMKPASLPRRSGG